MGDGAKLLSSSFLPTGALMRVVTVYILSCIHCHDGGGHIPTDSIEVICACTTDSIEVTYTCMIDSIEVICACIFVIQIMSSDHIS